MKPVYEEADQRFIYAKRLVLFSGIAKDGPLINYLSDKYKLVKRMKFPDHHKYSYGDLKNIMRAVGANPTAVVATTEKDAQRIVDTKKVPGSLKERLFQVPIEVSFLSPEETAIFEETLLELIRKSSRADN